MRERKEMIQFSRNDLEYIAKSMAKLRIVGDLFIGRIIDQEVQWHTDESLTVVVTYQEGTLDDIPHRNIPAIESPKEKSGRKHK
jgi:hypothetical protein